MRSDKIEALLVGSIFLGAMMLGLTLDCSVSPEPISGDTSKLTKSTVIGKPKKISSKPKYHYSITISTPEYEELQEVEPNGKYLKVKRRKIVKPSVPDGHYEWDMDIKLNSIQEIYDYLSKHHKDIKANSFDEISYYEDHRDDYLDDPEDEIRFPPEIFETLDN